MAEEADTESTEEENTEETGINDPEAGAGGSYTFWGHNTSIYDPTGATRPRQIDLLGDGTTDSSNPLTGIVRRHNQIVTNTAMTGNAAGSAAAITESTILIAVVTVETRMYNLGQLYELLEARGLESEVTQLGSIRGDSTSEIGLDPYMVPVVQARIEELMPMYPRPTNRGCGLPALGGATPSFEARNQKLFIGHPEHTETRLPTPGSLIAVRFEGGNWTNKVGYMVGIISLNRTLPYIEDACDESGASNASDNNQEEPQTLTEGDILDQAESIQAERNIIGRRFDQGQGGSAGIGPDGQRALGRGGAMDFASSFWQSATADRSRAEGTQAGSAAAADSRREQKPSNN